jgi:hypothetical protein
LAAASSRSCAETVGDAAVHRCVCWRLSEVDVRPLDRALGRAAGELLARTSSSDVIDAAVVLLAADGDDIVTLDRRDFETLVRAAGWHVELIRP